mgnify:CR=1 FL=1
MTAAVAAQQVAAVAARLVPGLPVRQGEEDLLERGHRGPGALAQHGRVRGDLPPGQDVEPLGPGQVLDGGAGLLGLTLRGLTSDTAIAAYCVVFVILVGALVSIARYVATRRRIAEILERGESVLFPLVLITLGVIILVSGGAFGL